MVVFAIRRAEPGDCRSSILRCSAMPSRPRREKQASGLNQPPLFFSPSPTIFPHLRFHDLELHPQLYHFPNSTSSYAHVIVFRQPLNRSLCLPGALPQYAILTTRPLTQQVSFAAYAFLICESSGRYSSKAQLV